MRERLLTFARDEVIRCLVVQSLALDELPCQFLFAAWEDEGVEGLVIPGDLLEFVDAKLACE